MSASFLFHSRKTQCWDANASKSVAQRNSSPRVDNARHMGAFLEVLKASNTLMDARLHMMYFREYLTAHALPSFHDYFSCTIMNVYSHAFIVQCSFLIDKLPRIEASSKIRESILSGDIYYLLSLL